VRGWSIQARVAGLATVLFVVITAAACGAAGDGSLQQHGGAPSGRVIGGAPGHPLLAVAIARGRDLGRLPAGTQLHFTLGLAGRDVEGLAAALAAGKRFSPGEFAARFGPGPAAVAGVRTTLARSGIATRWSYGETTLDASGTAAAVDAFFKVRIDERVGPDGIRFHAPAHPVMVPAALATVVNAVTGLDDYPGVQTTSLLGANGVTPHDMLDFYDATSARSAGLDGTGSTIVFVEIDRFNPDMLSMFAQKFNLPAFNVSVRSSGAWGNPGSEQGEADLDLEIAHGIAPGARLVVYYSSPNSGNVAAAEAAAYRAFPQGAIESKSLGSCEVPQAQSDATALNDQTTSAAAQGWTIFVASGDRGAYGCVPDGDFNTLSTNIAASVPNVTAVGGTYALPSASGGYFKEAAWGEPVEQWGSGGGPSIFWPSPSWQVAPGARNQFSNGMRQTPDVSANADVESGWDVFAAGQETSVGGTSAAAPFWAAIIAIIDQDLRAKGLPTVGFANPALYRFARNPAGLPSPPFHDIGAGTNLYYPATPGWDFATGLGTPDVSALLSDFEWLQRSHG